MVGVPIGLGVRVDLPRRRARCCRLAVVVAMTAVFAIGPLFGLPLIRRYVETPAVLLTLFYGLAVCRLDAAAGGPRAQSLAWPSAALAVALSVAYMPWHVDKLQQRRAPDRRRRPDVRRPPGAAEAPVVRAAFAALRAADRRRPPPDPVPALLARRRTRARSRRSRAARARWARLLLLPRRNRSTGRVYKHDTFPQVQPPAGFRQIYRNPSWRVFAAPGCA